MYHKSPINRLWDISYKILKLVSLGVCARRALHVVKRAPYSIKRALHSIKKDAWALLIVYEIYRITWYIHISSTFMLSYNIYLWCLYCGITRALSTYISYTTFDKYTIQKRHHKSPSIWYICQEGSGEIYMCDYIYRYHLYLWNLYVWHVIRRRLYNTYSWYLYMWNVMRRRLYNTYSWRALLMYISNTLMLSYSTYLWCLHCGITRALSTYISYTTFDKLSIQKRYQKSPSIRYICQEGSCKIYTDIYIPIIVMSIYRYHNINITNIFYIICVLWHGHLWYMWHVIWRRLHNTHLWRALLTYTSNTLMLSNSTYLWNLYCGITRALSTYIIYYFWQIFHTKEISKEP